MLDHANNSTFEQWSVFIRPQVALKPYLQRLSLHSCEAAVEAGEIANILPTWNQIGEGGTLDESAIAL